MSISRIENSIKTNLLEMEIQNLEMAIQTPIITSSPARATFYKSFKEIAKCGHPASSSGDLCSLLCEDFIESEYGLCYLKLFDDRALFMNEFGFGPKIKQLLKFYNNSWLGKTLTLEGSALHVGGDESGSVLESYNRCRHCKYKFSLTSPHFHDGFEYKCVCGNTLVAKCRVRRGFMNHRVCGLIGFDIISLLENLAPPATYQCDPGNLSVMDVTIPYKGDVKKIGNSYHVSIGPFGIVGTIHDIKNMSHDFVANCWESMTDQKLGLLGVEYPGSEMTPDGINVRNRNILELGTSYVLGESYLKAEFRGKEMKYEQEISHLPVQLNVLIVSFNQIFTNLPLNEMQACELCARYTMVKPLEAIINEMEGFNVFAQKDSSDVRLVKSTLLSITNKGIDSPTYNLNEIDAFQNPITRSEEQESKLILSQEFENAAVIKHTDPNAIKNYMSKFTPDNSRLDLKRVTNIPTVLHNGKREKMTFRTTDLPQSLKELWSASEQIQEEVIDITNTISRGKQSDISVIKHLAKIKSTFKFDPSYENKIQLSLLGLGQKEVENESRVREHEWNSKKSFHPSAPTFDIQDFHDRDWLAPLEVNDHKFENRALSDTVEMSKLKSTAGMNQESLNIWRMIRNTEIFNYSMMISEIFFELSIHYKQWTKPGTFMRKSTKSGIQMIIYNPKGHIFITFAFPRESKILSTGKIGPKCYVSESHIFTEFCSFNEPTIEHFTKAGPYIGGIAAHLMTNSSDRTKFDITVKEILPKIFLLFLNNKTDVEELITAQRYFFMKVFEDVGNDPYSFVSRLPEVLRSRLTSYYLQKTINLMEYYSNNSILKVPKKENTLIIYDYLNIKSVFTSFDLTIEQLINSFYFGYVISKERGRGNNRTFKVLKKILQQEFNFRDNIKNLFSSGLTTPKYSSNKSLLKVFSHLFSKIIASRIGDNYKTTILNSYCSEVATTNFSVLATLKAASRNHPDDFNSHASTEGKTSKEIFDELKKLNPEESKRRPKVLEALIDLVAEYMKDTGKISLTHEVELLPWCLDKLLKKGYFDSDCFAKPQHGGDREIHVLEICARIVQFHLEMISRVFCRFFPSETTINPDTKKFFVMNHYQRSRDLLNNNYFVMSKSADATKWCQCHHSSHFAAMFSVIAPKELRTLAISALSLWPHKRLSFPLQQVSDFLSNPIVKSNSTYERFHNEFYTGTGIFTQRCGNKINVISGMFQGILHTTSSLYHTMIQECMKMITSQILDNVKIPNHVITIVQGSDDSSMMLTLPGPISKDKLAAARRFLQFKECVTNHLSIYNSVDKSSIGTLDLVEYNSEWFVRHKIVKPTFRWVSAAFSINVTERFIDRLRNFNSVLTECLTGGASTLECAVIQLFQGEFHYMLLGLFSQPTKDEVSRLLLESPEPLLGFFPFDFDLAAGVTGIEFALYSLYQSTNYGSNVKTRFDTDVELSFTPDDAPSRMKTKDLQSVRLRFGHMSLYEKLLKNISLGTYEDAVESVDKDPLLIWGRHTSWEEEKSSLILKVFSPGVKESLSNVSPALRMIAASSYLHTFPCLSSFNEGILVKKSLLQMLDENNCKMQPKAREEDIFPLSNEFSVLYSSILKMTSSMATIDMKLRKVSKTTLIVFEPPSDQLPIVDLCKRKWLNIGKLPLSRRQADAHWVSARERFPFISSKEGLEGMRETADNLGCSLVELKPFLESLNLRSREIKLQDTEARGKDALHIMSRIYWPNTQVRHIREGDEVEARKLRSKLLSVSTYWQCSTSLSEFCKELLMNDELLSRSPSKMPNSLRKLKIMRDFLQGESRMNLLKRIEHLKIGVLGAFTRRQTGYGNTREGYGVWRGRVCGIDCEIIMTGNTCSKITLKALGDSRSLGLNLIGLLKEFSSSPSKIDNKSDYYLSPSGRITVHDNSEQLFNIYIDREMEESILTEIELLEWDVHLANNQNLRLIVRDNRGMKTEVLTILSDNLNSRDWTPDAEVNLDDTMLRKWSLGTMCTSELIESNLLNNFPKTRYDFSRGQWKDQRNTHPWDLSKFRTQMISYINPKLRLVNQKKDETLADEDFKEFKALTSGLWKQDNFSLMVEEALTDWADIMNEEASGESILPGVNQHELKGIDDLISMFSNVQDVDEEFLFTSERKGIMPTAHQFFSSLETLCQIQTNKSLRDLLSESSGKIGARYKGTLGKIMSILTGIWMFDSELEGEHESSKWEAESVAATESVLDDEDAMRMPEEKLESNIRELESKIRETDGITKLSLVESLDRFLRIRSLRQIDMSTAEVVETKQDFIISFIDSNPSILSEFAHIDKSFWERVLNLKLEVKFTDLLIKKKISNLEMQRVTISIKNPMLTEQYQQSCSELLN